MLWRTLPTTGARRERVAAFSLPACQVRLATQPHLTDETRGVSGYTFALPGEPDLDRILYLQPPVGFTPRSHSPPLGVTVTSGDAHRRHGRSRDSSARAVDLLGEPMLENRNWTLTLPGFEPIVPFELQIAATAATLRRDAPLNPADPDQPVWQVAQAL